ncbi:hypothetical protein EYC84_012074 [Monilinia fructicola]|uniref:Uncharacterized protein n=1 Tax=Monilinia fructicola TaxID=38448 RepID=A0A5M9J4F4_MONFR|nr:hypothetical protein EYC84_012074 [Monilinia fructicola]
MVLFLSFLFSSFQSSSSIFALLSSTSHSPPRPQNHTQRQKKKTETPINVHSRYLTVPVAKDEGTASEKSLRSFTLGIDKWSGRSGVKRVLTIRNDAVDFGEERERGRERAFICWADFARCVCRARGWWGGGWLVGLGWVTWVSAGVYLVQYSRTWV